MNVDRRALLGGLLTLAACGGAGRRATGDVLPAGQPAALLVLSLAAERLAGWPRRPSAAALAYLPPSAAPKPELGALASGGAPASLESVASLSPALVLDYGDLTPGYRALAERTERRLGAPYHLLDGALPRTAQAFMQAGTLLGAEPRGRALAERAGSILDRWAGRSGAGPSFYYARGGDGLETGFAGSLATETLEGGGWPNVAVGAVGIGRVSREQVAAWDSHALVTLDPAFARRALADPLWARRRSGAPRRVLLLPDLPFGWIDRPPSINRLFGCDWLAAGAPRGPAAQDRAAALCEALWGVRPSAAQAKALAPRWLA